MLIITETLFGCGSTITSSILSKNNPSVGIVVSSSTALLTSVAILVTNEYISKLRLRYTILRDWISFFAILFERTLNQLMIDRKIDEKEALKMKTVYNHYLDKRKEILNSTKFRVEDVFDDIISEDPHLPEQITKLNTFIAKIF